MATTAENTQAIESLETRLADAIRAIADAQGTAASAEQLAREASDELATVRAENGELRAALEANGAADANSPTAGELAELREALNELAARQTQIIQPVPGAGGADTFSTPKEGFPNGLFARIAESYHMNDFLRYLQARPLEPDAAE